MMIGFGEPSELKLLPEILMPDEILDDKFKYARAISDDKIFGILVITNRRIIFIGKSLFQSRTDDYLFGNIASISSATPFPLAAQHTVTITSKGNTTQYSNVSTSGAKEFVKRARELVFSASQPASPVFATPITSCIFCTQCGQELPPDALFCMKCGSKLSSPVALR